MYLYIMLFCMLIHTHDYRQQIWVAGPQLKERRSHAAAVSHNGNIFVIGGARPIECPSARGQLKITGTEALTSDYPMSWTPLPKFRVPSEAKIQTAALANSRDLLIVGKCDPSDIKRNNCFLMEESGWILPPGVESILISGTSMFFSYALLTLSRAAMQDLLSEDSE